MFKVTNNICVNLTHSLRLCFRKDTSYHVSQVPRFWFQTLHIVAKDLGMRPLYLVLHRIFATSPKEQLSFHCVDQFSAANLMETQCANLMFS